MASAAVAGFKSFCYVSTDGGSTYAALSEQKSVTLRFNTDKVETTNKTTSVSGGLVQKERLTVAGDFTATIQANLVYDAQQVALENAALAGTVLYFQFMREVGSGKRKLSCTALVEFENGFPLTDASAVTYTLTQATGLTAGTQA